MFFLYVLATFTGCGKREKTFEPPSTRAKLVIGLFDSLEKKNHDLSLKKIEKLRVLDPSNVFLANLEMIEKNNIVVCEVQKDINDGNLAGSRERIEKIMRKIGIDDTLVSLQDELNTVAQIQNVLNIFAAGGLDSVSMARNAGVLKDCAEKYKPAGFMVSLANEKLAEAKKLRIWEDKRSLEDLISDYRLTLRKNSILAGTVLASLTVESGNSEDLQKETEFVLTGIEEYNR